MTGPMPQSSDGECMKQLRWTQFLHLIRETRQQTGEGSEVIGGRARALIGCAGVGKTMAVEMIVVPGECSEDIPGKEHQA
jgi:hypothetical protein